jgi:Transcription factor WhiB
MTSYPFTQDKAPERVDTPPRNGPCKDYGPSVFFPHAEKDLGDDFSERYIEARENTKTAIEVCNECQQLEQCFAYSMYHEMYGIWAGTTERQRKTLRRKFRIKLVPREPIISIPGMNLKQ